MSNNTYACHLPPTATQPSPSWDAAPARGFSRWKPRRPLPLVPSQPSHYPESKRRPKSIHFSTVFGANNLGPNHHHLSRDSELPTSCAHDPRRSFPAQTCSRPSPRPPVAPHGAEGMAQGPCLGLQMGMSWPDSSRISPPPLPPRVSDSVSLCGSAHQPPSSLTTRVPTVPEPPLSASSTAFFSASYTYFYSHIYR